MLTVLSSRIAFEHPRASLTLDVVRYPDGSQGDYVYIARPSYVIVAAVEDGAVWMVEQWRHPLRRRSWELPMGVAPGTLDEAARTELREETGLAAARIERIAEIAPAPGLLAQTGVLYLAQGLSRGAQSLEASEQDLIAEPWPVARLLDAAATGGIVDAATLASLAILRLRGLL